ncbi:MAG: hypothetical protein MPJ22_00155 [Pirellulales bacterium]|nr:hypothetical protein [Pirellulales bacterium]
MTNVDEWTRADTGVGAAIAQVSHAMNGNWALLVIAANRISVVVKEGQVIISLHIFIEFHWPCDIVNVMASKIKQSPIRLDVSVINPLFKDLLFW